MVGMRFSYCPNLGAFLWFKGTILEYDRQKGRHRVCYDTGETIWVCFDLGKQSGLQLEWQLQDDVEALSLSTSPRARAGGQRIEYRFGPFNFNLRV